jgi:FkbM family methyltransferase
MKDFFTRLYLFIFSRPVFFNVFYYTIKICLYAMNRVSASYLEPKYSGEQEALKWVFRKELNRRDKLVVFDCGANNGSYTKMALDVLNSQTKSIDIFLFEPSQICFERLNKEFSKYKNIHLIQLAVSNTSGFAELYSAWEGSSGASLARGVIYAQGNESVNSKVEQIKITRLDDFCTENNIDKIDFLKLDIEGYEMLALEGANEILNGRKVSYIQIEIGSASLATKCMLFDIWKLLSDSYSFYIVLKHGLAPISYKPDLECFFGATNFLLELKQ